jgi:hypothetical protein
MAPQPRAALPRPLRIRHLSLLGLRLDRLRRPVKLPLSKHPLIEFPLIP